MSCTFPTALTQFGEVEEPVAVAVAKHLDSFDVRSAADEEPLSHPLRRQTIQNTAGTQRLHPYRTGSSTREPLPPDGRQHCISCRSNLPRHQHPLGFLKARKPRGHSAFESTPGASMVSVLRRVSSQVLRSHCCPPKRRRVSPSLDRQCGDGRVERSDTMASSE